MSSDGIIVLACVVLGLTTFFFIFFFREDPSDSSPLRTRLDQLLERRDTIYDNLRDLRFEHRAGKYSDQDYDEMKRSLESEAVSVVAEIEEAARGVADGPRRGPTENNSTA